MHLLAHPYTQYLRPRTRARTPRAPARAHIYTARRALLRWCRYDDVVSYDAIGSLARDPAVVVDMAGAQACRFASFGIG
jgi:hypothetical protein